MLVPGTQTVNRAELLAALQVVRLGHLLGQIPTHIHTDSAYVVRILSQFTAGLSASLLDSFANVDLLRLLEEVWFDKVSFTKVRSHRDPHTAVDQEDLLTILGNSKADEACARALQADLPVVADMVAATATSQDEQASLLRDVYRYLLELHSVTNLRLNQPRDVPSTALADPGDQPEAPDATVFMDGALEQWCQCRQCASRHSPLPQPDSDVFIHSTWGPDFTWQLWEWAQQLEWTDASVTQATGITTLELFCNFVVTTASLPPLIIPGPYNRRQCLPFDAPETRLHPRTLRSWLQALTSGIRQIERQAGVALFAGTASRRITTLQALGDTQACSGFIAACRFQRVEETAALLRLAILMRTTLPFWHYVREHSHRRLFAPRGMVEAAQGLTAHQKLSRRTCRRGQ